MKQRVSHPLLLRALLAAGVFLLAGAGQAATFGTPVTVRDNGGSEPGLKIAPDGTMYVFAATSLVIGQVPPNVSAVYRSDDGGATWLTTPIGLRQAAIGGGDVDLAISQDGSIATTDLWLGSSSVAVSHDKGQTWLASPLQGVVVEDRQWLATTPGRVYHVVHQVPSGHIVSTSLDGGLTYPIHSLAATPLDQTGCLCPPGNIVAEGAGTLGTADRLAFVYQTTTKGFGLARSTNGALTWTNTYPGASAGATVTGFPSIAGDGNGHLAVAWTPGSSGTVALVTSNDFGATWSAPRTIVSTGTSVYPWVAYRGGKIAVSVYHTAYRSDGVPDNVTASATWNISYLDSSDNFASLTDIEAIHQGPVCTQGINCNADREMGDFMEVQIDAAGKSAIAYNRDIAGGTQVRFVKQQ